jgi:hypothetical protein
MINALLLLLFLTLSIQISTSCSPEVCDAITQCEHFKSSPNLIRGTVISTYSQDFDGTVIAKFNGSDPSNQIEGKYLFEVSIANVFKTDSGLVAGTTVNITTEVGGGLCGSFLTEDIEWLLNGESVSGCSVTRSWENVSEEAKVRLEEFDGTCETTSHSGHGKGGGITLLLIALLIYSL